MIMLQNWREKKAESSWATSRLRMVLKPLQNDSPGSGDELFKKSDRKISIFSWKKIDLKKISKIFSKKCLFYCWDLSQWQCADTFGKSEDRAVLWAQTELEAHLLAFGCTIGAYLLAKDEGLTPTELRERAVWILDWISLVCRTEIHTYPKARVGVDLGTAD